MFKYVVATSITGTYLAVRCAEKPAGQIEEGEVIAEFGDKKTARDFCQTWYGNTKKQNPPKK